MVRSADVAEERQGGGGGGFSAPAFNIPFQVTIFNIKNIPFQVANYLISCPTWLSYINIQRIKKYVNMYSIAMCYKLPCTQISIPTDVKPNWIHFKIQKVIIFSQTSTSMSFPPRSEATVLSHSSYLVSATRWWWSCAGGLWLWRRQRWWYIIA